MKIKTFEIWVLFINIENKNINQLQMKDTYYNILVKGIITVCMIVMAVSMVGLNIKINNYIKDYNKAYNTYQQLIEEYDSTTNYNKIILYPKIKAYGDILN